MKAEKNKVVSISYILHNKEGELIDETTSEDPLELLLGSGAVIPALEEQLVGMAIGDKKTITLEPAEAYGEDDPELRVIVNRTEFPTDLELEPGFQFMTEVSDGSEQMFEVIEVDGDDVKIDGNHPLAGETLTFQIEIMGMREPTKDELDHGHVHTSDCDH